MGMAMLLCSAPAWAEPVPINEHPAIQEGSHYSLRIVRHGNSPYKIDVSWNSTAPVDVWLMRQDDFVVYDNGVIRFEVQQNGTQGRIEFQVTQALLTDEPFHLVVDHTTKGPTKPSANTSDDTITVDLVGEQVPDVTYTFSLGENALFYILWDLLILAGIPLAIWFVYGKWKRKREIKKWEAERAARRAQRAAAQAAGASSAPASGGDPLAALGSAKAQRSPDAQNWRYCGYCGAQLSPEFAFCRACGRPLK